jgi:AmiR/NasT family two-component response regulator
MPVIPAARMETPSRPRSVAAPVVARVLFANVTPYRYKRLLAALGPLGVAPVGIADAVSDVHSAFAAGGVDAVIAGQTDEDATLSVVRWVTHEESSPVILALARPAPAFVAAAAERGAFGAVVGFAPRDWQAALSVALARATQYRNLQNAFGRRARVERAKGILMERNGIDEHAAFELLRDHARRHSRRVVDVAESVLDSHRLKQEGGAELSG